MVANMISQFARELPAQARGLFFWNFIHKLASRCEDGTVTGDFLDALPNFHIDTFSELEERSGKFAEVSESDVEKFIKGGENANTKKKDLLRLKISQKASGRRAPRNQSVTQVIF